MCNNEKWNSCAVPHYKSVRRIKKQLLKEKSAYLCKHPEIRAILRVIIRSLLTERPKNFRKFLADYFCCGKNPLLPNLVKQQLQIVKDKLEKGRWFDYDCEPFVTQRKSTQSLLSSDSSCGNMIPLLTFALVFSLDEECDL